MKNLSVKYPIIFEIILFIIALFAAAVLATGIKLSGCEGDVSSSVARILVGVALMAVFHNCFRADNVFRGFLIMLPALLLAFYKIPYHFISGGGYTSEITLSVFLIGMAPAVFEEVLFRGIFIHNLKQKLNSPVAIVIISATLFSLIHLTNLVGMEPVSVILQVMMSFVVGVVLGAVYLRTGDILSVIFAHFAIDFLGSVFGGGETTPAYFLIIMIGLLLFELIYGLMLAKKS